MLLRRVRVKRPPHRRKLNSIHDRIFVACVAWLSLYAVAESLPAVADRDVLGTSCGRDHSETVSEVCVDAPERSFSVFGLGGADAIRNKKLVASQRRKLGNLFKCVDEVRFDPASEPQALLFHLADQLRGIGAENIQVDGNSIRFNHSVFRSSGFWHPLRHFERGLLTVDANQHLVQYSLSFKYLVIVAIAGSGFVTVGSALTRDSWEGALPLFFIGAAWLIGGNLLISIPRFREFIRRSVKNCSTSASR